MSDLPKQLVIDLFTHHQGFVVCCPLLFADLLKVAFPIKTSKSHKIIELLRSMTAKHEYLRLKHEKSSDFWEKKGLSFSRLPENQHFDLFEAKLKRSSNFIVSWFISLFWIQSLLKMLILRNHRESVCDAQNISTFDEFSTADY